MIKGSTAFAKATAVEEGSRLAELTSPDGFVGRRRKKGKTAEHGGMETLAGPKDAAKSCQR